MSASVIGRRREDADEPSTRMVIATYLFAIIVGALLNRHRGGWIGTGHTQLARLDFSVGMAAILLLISFNAIAAAIAIPIFFLGTLAGQGTDQGDDTIGKMIGLIGSGFVNFSAIPMALAATAIIQHIPISLWMVTIWLVVATCKPIVYFIGQHMPFNINEVFGQGFARGSTEWGELLFGMIEGAGIVATVYLR